MLSIIAVIAKNNAIGCNNRLLYRLPEDMARFKKLTEGHSVIMGRKTLESIGAPLPGRFNIIITSKTNYICPNCGEMCKNCIASPSFEDALAKAGQDEAKEVFVIGGEQIYKLALPHADKLYLTIVDDEPKEADAFFPDYSEFGKKVYEEEMEDGGYRTVFVELLK